MEPISGYIYVIFNEVYQFYGEHVYKVGKTVDIGKRALQYSTYYIKPIEIKYLSAPCKDYTLAEKRIFEHLKLHRIADNREFFNYELNKLIKVIEEIVNDINGYIVEVEPYEYKKASPSARKSLTQEERIERRIERRIDTAKQIIDDLGLNKVEKYNREDFITKLDYLFNEGSLKDIEEIRLLFGIDRGTMKNVLERGSMKSKIGLLNTILSHVGKRIRNRPKHELSYNNKTNYYKLESRGNSNKSESEPEELHDG